MSKLDPYKARMIINQGLREFFYQKSYLEVETPILVDLPGTEKYLRYFETQWVDYLGKNNQRWLRSSPELHMKKILAEGHPKIFQISKCFRNRGELSNWHHPEFSMLEWYEVGIDFQAYIQQTHELIFSIFSKFESNSEQLKLIEKGPTQISVPEAFWEFTKIELFDNDPDLWQKAREKKYNSVSIGDDFETAFFKILLDFIEPEFKRLGYVSLWGYPQSQAALAKVNGGLAERFEFYMHGVELCNGFNELTDLKQNQIRIRDALGFREKQGFEVPIEDVEFYESLAKGIPPCCGNALGVDRLLALVLGLESIEKIVPLVSVRGAR